MSRRGGGGVRLLQTIYEVWSVGGGAVLLSGEEEEAARGIDRLKSILFRVVQ